MTATTEKEEEEPVGLPPRQRMMVGLAILPAGAMQGMDTFATGVAIPRIMGSLSVTITEVSWVLTSYLVASAMFTPLFAWLSRKVGCKRLFIGVVFGFMCCSILISQSSSLYELVFFRFMQGVFGAGLNPLTTQVVLASFPKSHHGIAFGWLQMGRNSAVVIGPLVGGIITEFFDWHMVYLMNVPLAILALVLIPRILPKDEPQEPKAFDFFGFFSLSIAIVAVQLLLNQGEKRDWFESNLIVTCTFVGAAFIWIFLVHSATTLHSYLNLAVFKNREFTIGVLLMFFAHFMTYGYVGLLPPILQDQLGFPVIDAGMIIANRGVGTMCAAMVAGVMIFRFSPRSLITGGMLVIALATWMLAELAPIQTTAPIIAAVFLQGFGLGFIKTPIMTLSFSTLSVSLRPDAASVMATTQRLASSVGVSVLIALLVRNTQSARTSLVETVNSERIGQFDLADRWNLDSVTGMMALDRMIEKHAEFIAYITDFQLMTFLTLAMLPLLFFVRSQKAAALR
ncbi:MAG: DHA2 family efflux MFS transporter permease subunit [Proteobacteria bacterium]|nr:DHA2 family efflux MFS transporter permease subunit [Pseudomonadota bacterium]